MTVQPEHSQCHLVEMGSTTSLFTFLWYLMNGLVFTLKLPEKNCVRLSNIIPQIIMDRPHVVVLLTSWKVCNRTSFNIAKCSAWIFFACKREYPKKEDCILFMNLFTRENSRIVVTTFSLMLVINRRHG